MGFEFMSRIVDNETVDNYYMSMFLGYTVKANNYCCRLKNEVFLSFQIIRIQILFEDLC